MPPRRKLGETEPRPDMVALATPNTLRHTAPTEMHTRGVPEAQIDAAAGHAPIGTGQRNYRHLRPDYLREMIDGLGLLGRHAPVYDGASADPLRTHYR